MSPHAPHKVKPPFVVALGEWTRRPGTRLEVVLEARADELVDELSVSGSHVAPEQTITVEAALEIVPGGVVASGIARTAWEGECRRCLVAATGELEVSFTELCVAHPDDEVTYAVGAHEIDLEPLVHDACILELPLAPLCRPDCAGLCPECGVDRNHERCACAPSLDGRFAALAALYDEGPSREDPAEN